MLAKVAADRATDNARIAAAEARSEALAADVQGLASLIEAVQARFDTMANGLDKRMERNEEALGTVQNDLKELLRLAKEGNKGQDSKSVDPSPNSD